MAEWFEDWFGETYLEMYPHRDEQDAAAAVRLISESVPLRDARTLDLACGPGRHSNLLRGKAGKVFGLDLSAPLLQRARRDYSPPISVVRGDMRQLPFAGSSFDVVVNLFTSFGYFKTDNEHRAVLLEVARILSRGGWFVLDYLNAMRVKDDLVEHEELTMGGRRVSVSRWISEDGKYVFKNMDLVDEGRSYRERVRLFEHEDLELLLSDAGLNVRERYGSYQGDALADSSPRVLFLSVSA